LSALHFRKRALDFRKRALCFRKRKYLVSAAEAARDKEVYPNFPNFPQISAKEPCIFAKEPYVSANKVKRFTICCRSCAGEGGLCVHMNVGVDLGEGAGVGVDAGGCS